MSMIPGLERPAPVPNELTKPFWDACNERRLVLQICTSCERLQYPPTRRCDECGLADSFEWKEVQGRGHIDVYFVIRDSRIRGFRSAPAHQLRGDNLRRGPGYQLPVEPSGHSTG